MRQAFIIAALTLAAFLHAYTWKKEPAARSLMRPEQFPGAESGAALMIADISASREGDRITVVGRISDMWEPAGKRAPHTIILRDSSGALEIVHWLKRLPAVDIGDTVECTGMVDLYRGGLQLRLWNPRDLQILNP